MALIRMYQRRGTLEQWNTGVIPTTVILQPGEIGIETDTGRFKIGNGTNVWAELPYYLPDNNPTNNVVRQGKNAHDVYAKLSPLAPQYSQTFTGTQTLVPQSNTQVPLVVSGLAGQSAVLQRWRNNNDVTLASIDQTGKITAQGGAYFNANVDVNNNRITNVATPTNDNDAVSKIYVDNAIAGLAWKEAVHLIAHGTGNNVALTGNTGTLVIDGHDPLVQADSGIYRILLTAQTTAMQNGIYLYTDNGTTYTLTRSTDADSPAELKGSSVYVQEGTVYGTSSWVQSNYTIDSFDDQVWVQFSGAALITAGDGLEKDGNTIDVRGTADRITANADSIDIASTYVGQASITTLGTITTGAWEASVIGATKGGTGQSSYSVGDILYADTTTTLAKLIPGTAGHPLVSGGTGVAPSYAQVDTIGIANDAVTYDKIQNVGGQYRVLGRLSAGSGNVEELDSDNVMTLINQGNTDIAFNLLPVGTTSTTVAQGDHTHTLDGLSDVQIGTPALRQVLKYDGTKWINELPSGGISIGATAPTEASSGDAWFDSTDGSLYVYYDDGVASTVTNLVSNSNFKTNTDNWSVTNGTIAVTTSQQYTGTGSLEFVPSFNGSSTETYANVSPGVHNFSFYYKSTAAKYLYSFSATYYDGLNGTGNKVADNAYFESYFDITQATTSWQRYNKIITVPSGVGAQSVVLKITAYDPATYYIDAVQLTAGSGLLSYVDGTATIGASAQWVQVKANSALEASILTRMSAAEARLTDLEQVEPAAGTPRVANQAARDALYPSPVQGDSVFRADLGYEEKYYAAYNSSTNPDGTTGTPGWYEYRGGASLSENYFLNSDFNINQRNVSGTGVNGNFISDRWMVNANAGPGILEFGNNTFAAGEQPEPGVLSRKYISCWAAGLDSTNSFASISQRIEGVETLAGKTVTISFWAKANSTDHPVAISLTQNFGTGGSSSVVTSSSSKTLSSSWSRYSFTLNVPSISGKTIGASSYLQFDVHTSVGSAKAAQGYPAIGVVETDNTFYFWAMQIEQGPVATAFHRNQDNIQAELAACQRYCFRIEPGSTYGYYGSGGVLSNTSFARILLKCPVTLRAAASSVTFSGIGVEEPGVTTKTVSAITLNADYNGKDMIGLTVQVTSAFSAVGKYVQMFNTSSSGYLLVNAEL